MRKILLTPVILLLCLSGYSQLNNSWIDYSKTYYKFKLNKDTLCRITQPQLAALGLGSVPAQNFQLWRNGKEVRLFTSVASGVMGAGDYIEFWGEMNDGKPDKALYRNPDFQLSDRYNLNTDTVAYFLTVNPAGNSLRYAASVNNTAGNSLPADAYFMRRVEMNYHQQVNRGYAAVLPEYVYSSSYDIGEGWSTTDIAPGYDLFLGISGLNVYTSGPANSVMFTVSAAGNAPFTRELIARIWTTPVLGSGSAAGVNPMPFFTYHKDTVRNLPLSILLNPDNVPIFVGTNSTNANDHIIVSAVTLTYPATFNFNGQKNFYFELKPSAVGNYLVITNFNSNGIPPALYDYNNGRRYLGDISTPGQVKFALPASSDPVRKFNLVSQDPSNINVLTNIGAGKTFTNYALAANQGDYMIVSHPVLYNDGNGVNNVDLYRQYRSSAVGGGYNAKVYDINDLTDQFGFGINRHPSSIRDFIRFADQNFTVKPKYLFIIGRAMSYLDYAATQSLGPAADQLNLIPTFGWPASDALLVSKPGWVVPLVPVGRIGAINGTEVGYYLNKVKQYEQVQQSPVQTIAMKGWMKNFLHTTGPADTIERDEFRGYMDSYKALIQDTFYGGHVETFEKTSIAAIEQQQSQRISDMFQNGLGGVNYFGHSSANELAINLNYPETYNNTGKYPFVSVSGCTVGNFYTYNVNRPGGYAGMSLSEKYVLGNNKGSVAFIGSSHFGIAPFLNYFNSSFIDNYTRAMYENTIGNQMKNTLTALGSDSANLDYYTRIHLEELNLHGDPALKINSFHKPDYVIEDQLVKFTPSIITVANGTYNVDIKMMNIGKAIRDSINVSVKQKLPDGTIRIIYNHKIRATYYMDSLNFNVPINPITDKGLNQLIVEVEDEHRIDELSETNNLLVKDFYIFEDDLRPVSPYNFSIVNQQNITYYASTANPLLSQRQYVMEVDTTELFNSPFKKTYNSSGTGGVIEFKPTNLTFTDSTVYYWRTAVVPAGTGQYIWNTSSFIYLSNSSAGSNQSHYYQHLKSTGSDISIQPNRLWQFSTSSSAVKIKNGVFPTAARDAQDFAVEVDGSNNIQSVCGVSAIIFNVFSPFGMEPWINNINGAGFYGSDPVCGNPQSLSTRRWNFQFNVLTRAKRDSAVAFMDLIPNGYYVTVRYTSGTVASTNTYAADWAADDPVNHKTLYDRLKAAGFTQIDSFNRPRAFNFIYKKNDNATFTPMFQFSEGLTDKIVLDAVCPVSKPSGTIVSPAFGPARSWSQFHWRGGRQETAAGDSISFSIIGVTPSGTETTLYTIDSTIKDFNISAINASQYPYLKLKMYNQDKVQGTPYQLRYWRLNYTPLPEGAVAPNILFSMKDTADQGEPINFKLAFKNISAYNFDSLMKISFVITDKSNQQHPITLPRGKILVAGDTLVVSYTIDTRNLPGANVLAVDVNPANAQPEQYHFNNVLYKDFYVKADKYNPLLDVTFDGVHILNKDIVSSKPHILASLKDESRFLALSDTSLIKVQVRYPDGSLHNYSFGDTMRFTPANLATGHNTATIDFLPYFPQDGEYELIVSGKDAAGNVAGALDYHVIFTVINKPMISNLLNYPNPFTTSTAFVFKITGSEVPQNIRIQILTVTGKVVKEITKDELGPLHVGTNITEYKWDGTDMYGAKLANGVYLYRVLTNLNGKSLDKYTSPDEQTDKYFTKGYGKMVLIR
ncbi:MAG: C25 family cysteine peptidase [Ferruginibacter sp.]